MDNGTMNQKKIRAKYARYLAWSQSATGKQYLIDLYRHHGASEPRPIFRLLVIARSRTGKDDQRRMLELRRPAAKLPAMMQDRMWFTTVDDLCRGQHHPLPLEAAIWRRTNGVDPRSYLAKSQLHGLFPRGTDNVANTVQGRSK
jgi:hypothetical protein